MMTTKYCSRNEIKKLEMEIWHLKVKGTDLASYTQRFQELALMCGRMFPEESDVVEMYVGGLPDMIQGNVTSSSNANAGNNQRATRTNQKGASCYKCGAQGCTLNFLNHPFNIDLMNVELGSFDVIIGMNWLVKYHAVIVCDEKLVRIP
ncbi:putative reverse transcriptase domain-containing protein [Tanacetum coccineum]